MKPLIDFPTLVTLFGDARFAIVQKRQRLVDGVADLPSRFGIDGVHIVERCVDDGLELGWGHLQESLVYRQLERGFERRGTIAGGGSMSTDDTRLELLQKVRQIIRHMVDMLTIRSLMRHLLMFLRAWVPRTHPDRGHAQIVGRQQVAGDVPRTWQIGLDRCRCL